MHVKASNATLPLCRLITPSVVEIASDEIGKAYLAWRGGGHRIANSWRLRTGRARIGPER